jgi:two-component system sensor histidine kinase ChiS
MRTAILCVDDEAIVRTSLKGELRAHFGTQHRLEMTESGEAALEVLDEMDEEGVDLAVIIVDQIMPGMKGDELLIEVHRRYPRTKKILLTGQASADAVGNAVNGADLYSYISKPWAREEMLLTVREAARSYTQDRKLDEQNEELRGLNLEIRRKMEAFFSFVPREFLQLLGVGEAYDSVSPGMGVDMDMAVLFSDIRRFTNLCEGISPAECVKFINDYVTRVAEPIHAHGGFVEGFSGDGIMAMFPGAGGGAMDGADNAVAAGIGMGRALVGFNEDRARLGLATVDMGVGVNAGHITLGMIGQAGRLKCGVAGDTVNLASRVESLTKKYGVHMLVSDSVIRALSNPAAFAFRQVDRVQVMGRTSPVDLFEVLDTEAGYSAGARLSGLRQFNEAIELYYTAEFTAAGRLFAECLVLDPTDNVALRFLSRCHKYGVKGVDASWAGVERVQHK